MSAKNDNASNGFLSNNNINLFNENKNNNNIDYRMSNETKNVVLLVDDVCVLVLLLQA